MSHGGAHSAGDYDLACSHCEHPRSIDTEEERSAVLGEMRKNKTNRGQCLRSGLPTLNLHSGDRLEPSPGLPDMADLRSAPLPVHVMFWRRHADARRRCTDRVHHRNPLFDPPLMDVVDVIMIDTLHCIYLGVILRYVSVFVGEQLTATLG